MLLEGIPISNHPDSGLRWSNPLHLLAFGLGSGAMPMAPGTFGTLAALPLYLLLRPLPAMAYLLLVAGMFLFGVWLCEKVSQDLGVHDHGGIVWDEWVGLLITLWSIPAGWGWIVAGFVLFRFFDILKPWPIGWLDRKVAGGLGIMLDDLIAGLFAWGILQVLIRII